MTNPILARLRSRQFLRLMLLGFLVPPLFAILSAFMWLTRRVDWYAATAATLPGEA